jgi:hypothetical protein
VRIGILIQDRLSPMQLFARGQYGNLDNNEFWGLYSLEHEVLPGEAQHE